MRELPDGKVLVHCWSCTTPREQILEIFGIRWADISGRPSTADEDFGAVPLPHDEQQQEQEGSSFEREVEQQLRRLRVVEAAKGRFAAEQRGVMAPLDGGMLADILARPPAPPPRIEGLLGAEANMLAVAMRKTGKTVFALNLARSVITGEPFLGSFLVRPVQGTVGFLNYEVSPHQIAQWAQRHGIPPDRLYIANFRGRTSPLDHPGERARLAEQLSLHGVEVLIADPFGRAYTGKSQNDAGEVSAWLNDLDRFARQEVGATEMVLTAHAGWEGDHVRGSTALEDWADSLVWLRKEKARPTRYFRATIRSDRESEISEDALYFDQDTLTLSLSGMGGPRQAAEAARESEIQAAVEEYVKANPGVSRTAIVRDVVGADGSVRAAIEAAIVSGVLVAKPHKGKGGGTDLFCNTG
ncbi:AAA family ATPase [Sinomonas sp. ASV486]|uniref:AAA family ATPase n=1 Tax=Sinomonas sp. ASV486 TaxID=3051170 RepID=UPI0027DD038F|nr:AAA family ATPase [Sinomonas sp. ASV486]MDQ4490708.1 AAA family ATPase [Sinomonas sp. ASV486]